LRMIKRQWRHTKTLCSDLGSKDVDRPMDRPSTESLDRGCGAKPNWEGVSALRDAVFCVLFPRLSLRPQGRGLFLLAATVTYVT
jgi:hypothetical protein